MFHVDKCSNSLNQTVTEKRLTRISKDYSLGLFKKKQTNNSLLPSSSLSINEKIYFWFET